MSTTPSGNHESPKSKILKRKKARSNTPLSCKIEYYIKTNSAYFSDQSAFFTDLLIRVARVAVGRDGLVAQAQLLCKRSAIRLR